VCRCAFLRDNGQGHRIAPPRFLCAPISGRSKPWRRMGYFCQCRRQPALQHIAPRDLVVPNQLFDRTKAGLIPTFYRGRYPLSTSPLPNHSVRLWYLLARVSNELEDVSARGRHLRLYRGPLFPPKLGHRLSQLGYGHYRHDQLPGETGSLEGPGVVLRHGRLCHRLRLLARNRGVCDRRMVIRDLSANVANASAFCAVSLIRFLLITALTP